MLAECLEGTSLAHRLALSHLLKSVFAAASLWRLLPVFPSFSLFLSGHTASNFQPCRIWAPTVIAMRPALLVRYCAQGLLRN